MKPEKVTKKYKQKFLDTVHKRIKMFYLDSKCRVGDDLCFFKIFDI